MVTTSLDYEHEEIFIVSVNGLVHRRWKWPLLGAAFGLFGGILSPLIGAAITVVSWLTGPVWHALHLQRIGTVLLVLTFPLLVFGAHCLDLVERESRNASVANHRSKER